VIATTTDYDGPFASSVETGALFACQFHPEKSQRVGLTLLRNFLTLAGAERRLHVSSLRSQVQRPKNRFRSQVTGLKPKKITAGSAMVLTAHPLFTASL
jgi:hypothetical protein